MIDTERQEWIRDHTRGDVTEAEVLKEYNILWPARRYMGRIIDEADALVECGWAKYKIDQVIVPDHVRIVLSLQDMIDLHRQNAKEESHE